MGAVGSGTPSLLKATPEPGSDHERCWPPTFTHWRWLGQVRAHALHSGTRAVRPTYTPQQVPASTRCWGPATGAPSPSCLLLGSRLLAGRPDGAGRVLGQPVVPRAPHTAKGWGPPPPSPSRVDLYFVMCLPFGALAVHSRISGRITRGVGRRQALRSPSVSSKTATYAAKRGAVSLGAGTPRSG